MTKNGRDPEWAKLYEGDLHIKSVDVCAGDSPIAWMREDQAAAWRFYAPDWADDVPHTIWANLTDDQRALCAQYEPDFFIIVDASEDIHLFQRDEWQRVCEIIAEYEGMRIEWE